jgi:hypothetical protein
MVSGVITSNANTLRISSIHGVTVVFCLGYNFGVCLKSFKSVPHDELTSVHSPCITRERAMLFSIGV